MNELMRKYELLRLACEIDVEDFIVFPAGVVSVRGNAVEHSKVLHDEIIAACAKDDFDWLFCFLCWLPQADVETASQPVPVLSEAAATLCT